eukprot:COSAG05_NODE_13300_length_435_cov_0.589286_2_plen_66_part_01
MQDSDALARSLGRSWTTHAGPGGGRKKKPRSDDAGWDSLKLDVPAWGDEPQEQADAAAASLQQAPT